MHVLLQQRCELTADGAKLALSSSWCAKPPSPLADGMETTLRACMGTDPADEGL